MLLDFHGGWLESDRNGVNAGAKRETQLAVHGGWGGDEGNASCLIATFNSMLQTEDYRTAHCLIEICGLT